MSEETNQPNQQHQPSPGPQQPKKKDTLIYLGVIAVLLIVIIALMVNRSHIITQNKQAQTDLIISDSTRTSLEGDYKAALVRLDQLTSRNMQMDSMINNKNSEITQLKMQIQGILSDSRATASQLKKARDLIKLLNNKTTSYEERIAQLESENSDLSNSNQVLAKERDSTVNQNIALKNLGSVLHASNIRMVPLHLKHGGRKEKETTKARKVDVFRIYFDIDENRIAENGVKNVYIRIIDPSGHLLSNAAYGSGVTSLSDGSTLNYTLVKQINLQTGQPVKDVTVDWHQDSNYDKGQYSIEIFNSGYRIGSGTVTLH